jgi:hypothetical protein
MVSMLQLPSTKGTLVILTFACLAGCRGDSVGTVIEIKAQTRISWDKNFYEEYAELKRAGAKTDHLTDFDSEGKMPNADKWGLLDNGSHVRVLSSVPDGVKVVVERATNLDMLAMLEEYKATKKPAKKQIFKEVPYLNGRTGYIHRDDIRR